MHKYIYIYIHINAFWNILVIKLALYELSYKLAGYCEGIVLRTSI